MEELFKERKILKGNKTFQMKKGQKENKTKRKKGEKRKKERRRICTNFWCKFTTFKLITKFFMDLY